MLEASTPPAQHSEPLPGGIVAPHDGQPERMEHTGDLSASTIERHGVAEHDPAFPKRVGQHLVGRPPRSFEAIGLREDDVERHRGRPKVPQA